MHFKVECKYDKSLWRKKHFTRRVHQSLQIIILTVAHLLRKIEFCFFFFVCEACRTISVFSFVHHYDYHFLLYSFGCLALQMKSTLSLRVGESHCSAYRRDSSLWVQLVKTITRNSTIQMKNLCRYLLFRIFDKVIHDMLVHSQFVLIFWVHFPCHSWTEINYGRLNTVCDSYVSREWVIHDNPDLYQHR